MACLPGLGLGLGDGLRHSACRADHDAGSPGVPLDVATRRAAIVSDLRYELSLSIPEALASPLTGTTTIRFDLKDASAPLVIDFETSREHVKSVDANGKPVAVQLRQRPHRHSRGVADGRRQHDPHRVQRRRRVAQSQQRFPLHAVRAGAGAAGVAGVRSARPQGPLDADARASRRSGSRRPTAPSCRAPIAGDRDDGDVRRNRSRCRRIWSRSSPATSRSRPPSATAARSGCSIAKPTPRRWRATATRFSICTRARSSSSSATPRFRTRSASSTSSRSPRSSSAAWSTPARFSTTRRG